jgi:hypothetical protein
LALSDRPVLAPGELGAFDDSGVLPSWLVKQGETTYLYYVGYHLGVTVPFSNFIGLATAEVQGAPFRKVSRAPILDRNEFDPFLTITPCVLIEDGLWRMWYSSGTHWSLEGGNPKHHYCIKYAESRDGFGWKRTGITCIEYSSPAEYAVCRPCVLRDQNIYKMWFCYRGESYQIGYAESIDGIEWERKDAQTGIDVSEAGWDSQMVAYPFVFDHEGIRYLLYNGNDYGRSGFGLAEMGS